MKIEQNCRTDGLDMRISEIRDDFKMELSYTKMRVMVQGAWEWRGQFKYRHCWQIREVVDSSVYGIKHNWTTSLAL